MRGIARALSGGMLLVASGVCAQEAPRLPRLFPMQAGAFAGSVVCAPPVAPEPWRKAGAVPVSIWTSHW